MARYRRNGEPQPPAGKPTKPAWLTGEGAKLWKQVTAQLAQMGTLAKSDAQAIARYCDQVVRWVAAAEFLKKYGETYPLKDDKGKVRCFQQFPQVGIVNKLSVSILRLEQEFGLTPSSRARLKVDTNERRAPVLSSRLRVCQTA